MGLGSQVGGQVFGSVASDGDGDGDGEDDGVSYYSHFVCLAFLTPQNDTQNDVTVYYTGPQTRNTYEYKNKKSSRCLINEYMERYLI